MAAMELRDPCKASEMAFTRNSSNGLCRCPSSGVCELPSLLHRRGIDNAMGFLGLDWPGLAKFQKAKKDDPSIEVMWLEVDDVPQPSSQAELYAANMIVEDIVNGMSFCASFSMVFII